MVFLVLAWPMLAGKVYTLDDLTWFHLPARAFYSRCLANGDGFTWTGDIFCGFYLHGDGQVGMYHPLHLALYRMLPLVTAFNLEILLNYVVMLFGMYFFLRRRRMRKDAALFGAMVFTFSGFNLLHFMHVNGIAIVSQIPWMLFAIDVVVRGTGRAQAALAAVGVAVLTGSEVLFGYPQYVWFSLVAESLYALLVLPERKTNWAFVTLAAAKAVGFGLGAVQMIPTLDMLRHSFRGATPLTFRYEYSLKPLDLVQLVAPYLLSDRVAGDNTHETGLYNGAVVTVLIVWLLFALRSLGSKRRLALGAIAMMVIAYDLALGPGGNLMYFLVRMPMVGLFRAPGRYTVLIHLAMAVAAALSFETICRGFDEHTSAPWSRLRWLGVLQAAAIVIAGLTGWPGNYLKLWAPLAQYAGHKGLPILAGAVLVSVAVFLVVAALRGSRLALVGIVFFAAFDLGVYGISYIHRAPVQTLQQFVTSTEMPPDADGYRVASKSTYDDIWLLGGYRLVYGYVGLFPAKTLDYEQEAALRVAGAKWLYASVGDGDNGRDDWVEVPNPLPRARLVTRTYMPFQASRNLYNVDVDTTAVVQHFVELPEGHPGDAVITLDRPGRITVATKAASRQLLIMAESYDAGWTVRVDDSPQWCLRVYSDFMGCVVEAGEHTVEFAFVPKSLKTGGLISIAALAALPLLFLSSLYRRRTP